MFVNSNMCLSSWGYESELLDPELSGMLLYSTVFSYIVYTYDEHAHTRDLASC